jgi:hypothetical protein
MFKNILLSVFLMGLFLGCSHKSAPEYSSKEYENVNKDAILNAAKRVLKLSDNDFSIDSKRNSIDALKIIPKNKGYTVDININKVKFIAVQEDNQTKAKLKITHKEDIYSKKEHLILGDAHILFWKRVDYILGLHKTWPTCAKHRIKLNFDGIFCDVIHNQNNNPSSNDIIKDIAISAPQNIQNDENISLVTIDLSTLESIELPINQKDIIDIDNNIPIELNQNENNESNISIDISENIIDINDSNLSNESEAIIQENNETNKTLKSNIPPQEDTNNSLIIPLKDLNKSTLLEEDENITIKEASNIEKAPSQKTIDNSINKEKVINANTKDLINSLSGFPRKFMEADPKKYFTINLALLTTDLSTGLFLNRHKIEDNAFPIKFTKNGKNYVKVVYGLYPTKEKATEAINNLSNALKANKPTIEGIGRKQTLYRTNDINLSQNTYKKKK